MSEPVGQLTYGRVHEVTRAAGGLAFVGGAADFSASGSIRNSGDLKAQLADTLDNVEAALGVEGCTLADAVLLQLFLCARCRDERVGDPSGDPAPSGLRPRTGDHGESRSAATLRGAIGADPGHRVERLVR